MATDPPLTPDPPRDIYHANFHEEHGEWCRPDCPFDYATKLAGAEAELLALRSALDELVAASAAPGMGWHRVSNLELTRLRRAQTDAYSAIRQLDGRAGDPPVVAEPER